jgi:hypothetical protein
METSCKSKIKIKLLLGSNNFVNSFISSKNVQLLGAIIGRLQTIKPSMGQP